MLNRLISWSLDNRLIVVAATLALFVIGGYVLQRMPVDVFPEFAPPQVVIQTEAPGMAPQDVETLITYPLESAINGTPGVSSVRSKTSVGLSTITVIFDTAGNIYLDRQLISERIQSAAALARRLGNPAAASSARRHRLGGRAGRRGQAISGAAQSRPHARLSDQRR